MLLDKKKTITEMQSQNIFWKRKNKGLFSSIILTTKPKNLINICRSETNHIPLKKKILINICGSEINHTPYSYDTYIYRINLIS